jgi:hypothetical protein
MPMPGAVQYQNKGIQSGTGVIPNQTGLPDAGMPMPAALDSMSMPSYGRELHHKDPDESQTKHKKYHFSYMYENDII